MLNQLKNLIMEDGNLSLGRIMLIITFITIFTINIIGLFNPLFIVSDSMTNLFYTLCAYCFGNKGITMVNNSLINKSNESQEQKTISVDNPG